MKRLIFAMFALIHVEAAGQAFTALFPVADTHFSTFGGHPYFTLNPGHRLVLEGEDSGEQIQLIVTVLNQTKEISLTIGGQPRAITVRAVEEREIIDGSLTEVGRFWYARSRETGDIYFFGEEADFYADGVLVGEAVLWEAGVDGAWPGIIMPGTFLLGARYYQNQALTALDGAENVAMGVETATPAGSFSNCVQVLESDLLRAEEDPAIKTYAPGIGLVDDDHKLLLKERWLGTAGLPAGGSFVPFSSHPLFPLSPGRRLVYEGNDDGRPTVLIVTVLDEVRTIDLPGGGTDIEIPTRVVEERKTVDGGLVEVSRKLYAQCLETGDVHCFGRETDRYEDGMVVDHAGSWLAGVESAEAGIVMPSVVTPGARYLHGYAPGVAGDVAYNSEVGISLVVPAGAFSNCVRITLTSLVEGAPREMIFAPAIGLISDDGVLNLASYSAPALETNAPVVSLQDAVLVTWPITHQDFKLENSPDLENWSPVPRASWPVDGRNEVALPRDRTRHYFRLAPP
jgi:hypothetical protein